MPCSGTAGSSVGRGFEGRAAAQQRGRMRDLGAALIQIFWLNPLFFSKLTPECSFKFSVCIIYILILFLMWFMTSAV